MYTPMKQQYGSWIIIDMGVSLDITHANGENYHLTGKAKHEFFVLRDNYSHLTMEDFITWYVGGITDNMPDFPDTVQDMQGFINAITPYVQRAMGDTPINVELYPTNGNNGLRLSATGSESKGVQAGVFVQATGENLLTSMRSIWDVWRASKHNLIEGGDNHG